MLLQVNWSWCWGWGWNSSESSSGICSKSAGYVVSLTASSTAPEVEQFPSQLVTFSANAGAIKYVTAGAGPGAGRNTDLDIDVVLLATGTGAAGASFSSLAPVVEMPMAR